MRGSSYSDPSAYLDALRLGFATAALRAIPKGLRPPAQGWRGNAYLGCAFGNESPTPTALWPRSDTAWKRMGRNRVAVGGCGDSA